MTLMQWILIGIGGVLFLTGAILLLIGIIKKKSLVLWKLLPGAVILCGLVLAGMVGLNFMGQQQLTQRENYVASRLIELESYAPAQLAAETALNRSPNVQSAQLAVLSLALEGRYSQGEQAASRYNNRFGDATLEQLEALCQEAAGGQNKRADLLQILKQIKAQLRLSDNDRSKAESVVNIQMAVSTGEGADVAADLENLAGETDPLSLKASAQARMAGGDPQAAFELLEQAALKDNSFPARAALAQMAANGYKRTTDELGNTTDSEQAALEQQMTQKYEQIDKLQERLYEQAGANEQQRLQLEKQISDLEEEIEELYQESSSIPVRRAVNYILSSNPSEDDRLAYNLTLAQLYFRSGALDTARTYLEELFTEAAAGENSGYLSVECANLLEAYDNNLKGAAAENTGAQDGAEEPPVLNNDPAAAVQKLLSAMTQYTAQGDVSYTENAAGADGEENMKTVVFSQFLLETLQDIRAGIHIGRIDTSNYPEISVTVNISRSKKNQETYQKEDFTVKEQGAEVSDFELVDTSAENAGSNVCLVVDHSGSMTGTNLEQAQRAVSSFIQTAGSKMKTGLVAFDDVAEMLCPMTESTDMVQRAVDNLTADGGTHIANGLVSAMNALQNQSGNRVIILLSDGEDSEESANQMDSVINQLTQQGIVVYAVGFDFADSAYLSRICEATGGKFLRSESSEDLGSVYQTIEKFLSQDYVIRFTVSEEAAAYDRNIHVSIENGVFDERDYFVGVSPEKIEEEANLPPQSDLFQQTGGSGNKEAVE